MKVLATFCLVVALLAAPASNAAAYTFTLYDNFPESANGENSLYTAAHYNGPPETLTPLANTGPYAFSLDGVSVERTISEPWILMTPSSTGDAVLYNIPPGVFFPCISRVSLCRLGRRPTWLSVQSC